MIKTKLYNIDLIMHEGSYTIEIFDKVDQRYMYIYVSDDVEFKIDLAIKEILRNAGLAQIGRAIPL